MSTRKQNPRSNPLEKKTIPPEQQVNEQIAIMDAIGQAIGRAAPLLAQFPPTDFHAAGYTRMKLEHLYNEMLSTPQPGALHFTRAAVINGIMTGIADWQVTQSAGGVETH